MSVRELATVQSFPDDFIFQGTKTSNYRQVANAVPPTLGRAIGKMLSENEKEIQCRQVWCLGSSMAIPVKPFPSYKWRWLSWLPTEGLLRAPVFLGVLRALHKHQGYPYSSTSLRDGLHRVSS